MTSAGYESANTREALDTDSPGRGLHAYLGNEWPGHPQVNYAGAGTFMVAVGRHFLVQGATSCGTPLSSFSAPHSQPSRSCCAPSGRGADMGLLDDVKAAKAAATAPRCSLCAWLATKPESFRAEVAEVLATGEETNTIHAVLTEKHGLARSSSTLGRHRRECTS